MPSSKNYVRNSLIRVCDTCKQKYEVKVKNKVQRFCSLECKGKWKYKSKIVTTETQYEKISGNWERYLRRLLYAGGKKRALLSVEELLEILEDQDYRCAISGIPMTCLLEKGTKFPYNVSVDRVKAGGSYTKDNIQLVCNCLNSWRGDTDLEFFIEVCKKVADYNSEI